MAWTESIASTSEPASREGDRREAGAAADLQAPGLRRQADPVHQRQRGPQALLVDDVLHAAALVDLRPVRGLLLEVGVHPLLLTERALATLSPNHAVASVVLVVSPPRRPSTAPWAPSAPGTSAARCSGRRRPWAQGRRARDRSSRRRPAASPPNP